MIQLIAKSGFELLENYHDKQGRFLKTFALNDKRNNNQWRVTWDSIKRNIHTFLNNKPGISYTACKDNVCDLDHIEGLTKQHQLEIQEPYRVSDIIDYTLDEATHTAYFIHKIVDDDFWDKLQQGDTIKFVSSAVWPDSGGAEKLGYAKNGLPIIDTWDWEGTHIAFLTQSPAYGTDKATVQTSCEGTGKTCQMKLLSSKEYDTHTAEIDGNLSNLRQESIMIKHNGAMQFVSVTNETLKKLQSKLDDGETVCPDSLFADSSHIVQCKSNAMDEKELQSKLKASEEEKEQLESKLKASEDDTNGDTNGDKVKELESKLKASEEETDKTKKENESLTSKVKTPLVATLLSARENAGATKDQLESFGKSLSAKSVLELEEKIAEEQILYAGLQAKQTGSLPQNHFAFNGEEETGSLTAKSIEETMGEMEVLQN